MTRQSAAFSLICLLLTCANPSVAQQAAQPAQPAAQQPQASYGPPPVQQPQPPASQPQSGTTPAPAAEAAEPARAPLPNTLMDGTAIKLRISETISSADAHVNQQVPFETTEDVLVQGVIVIPKGSPAIGTVTEAEPKRRMGRGGKLNVNIDSVRLSDGEKVQLRAIKNTKGGGHVGAMTGAMVATSIVFFPAAPLFLFMKGKDITIPKGTEITSFVQGDTRLDTAKFSAPVQGSPTPAPAEQSSLTIDSSPSGADITIDGNFAGSTPSTLSVSSAQHTVTVSKPGYTSWTRTMMVSGTAIHLNAELAKQP